MVVRLDQLALADQTTWQSVNEDLDLRQFIRWTAAKVVFNNTRQGQRSKSFGDPFEFANRPPTHRVHDLHFEIIRHPSVKSRHMNDVILFVLANTLLAPIKRVLSTPEERPQLEAAQAKLLAQLSPKSRLYRFARLKPTARRDPKPVPTVWRRDTEEERLVVRSKNDGADRISIDDHYARPSAKAVSN
jgi:hypothetical protein